MTEQELKEWITEYNIEFHWCKNDYEEDDVIIFPYTFQMERFAKLIKKYDFSEGGIPMVLKDGYFGVHLLDICEYFGINLEDIFPKDKKWDD